MKAQLQPVSRWSRQNSVVSSYKEGNVDFGFFISRALGNDKNDLKGSIDTTGFHNFDRQTCLLSLRCRVRFRVRMPAGFRRNKVNPR